MVIKPYRITLVDNEKKITDSWLEAINLLYVASVARYPNETKIMIRMINKQQYIVHDSTFDQFMQDINEAYGHSGIPKIIAQASAAAVQVLTEEEEEAKKKQLAAKNLDLD